MFLRCRHELADSLLLFAAVFGHLIDPKNLLRRSDGTPRELLPALV